MKAEKAGGWRLRMEGKEIGGLAAKESGRPPFNDLGFVRAVRSWIGGQRTPRFNRQGSPKIHGFLREPEEREKTRNLFR